MSEVETEIDYGPLTVLIGVWEGGQGEDLAPEPDGEEHNPYYETIAFEAIGDVSNAESQTLVALHYRQIVKRKSNDKVFHDETGYWMWDAESDMVMHSLTIPRAVALLAGGKARRDGPATVFEVSARLGDSDWGISQSPFMRDNAKTTAFAHTITVIGDELIYAETTMLDIYGRSFEHTDKNVLTRRR